MTTGYTLNAISVGKQIYTPELTPFDTATSKNTNSFANAQNERLSALEEARVEGTLTRQTVSLITNPIAVVSNPDISVNDSSPCRSIQGFIDSKTGVDDTSCHIMRLTEVDHTTDEMLNYQYFPLIKQEYMPLGTRLKDRSFLGVKGRKEYLHYDPIVFPSWCGQSASFSIWIENVGLGGYIISRYKTSETPWSEKYWKLLVGPTGDFLGVWAPPSVSQPGSGAMRASFPESLGRPLANMKSGQRRHLAWTFNHRTDVTCAYLDGIKILCHQQNVGTVGNMDCGMDDPNTSYVALNHRIPGMSLPLSCPPVCLYPFPTYQYDTNVNTFDSFLSLCSNAVFTLILPLMLMFSDRCFPG